jgi:hypothetical protein
MLETALLVFAFLGPQLQTPDTTPPAAAAAHQAPEQRVIEQIAKAGRVADPAETPDQRVAPTLRIAPGLPPLLSFRYYEGKLHHRFENSQLMLDDAGH